MRSEVNDVRIELTGRSAAGENPARIVTLQFGNWGQPQLARATDQTRPAKRPPISQTEEDQERDNHGYHNRRETDGLIEPGVRVGLTFKLNAFSPP